MRYADDVLIFCRSRKSAERTLANIIPFIEGKLFLKVNRTKTTVTHVGKIKYLGYAFYRNKGKCRFRVHPKSVQKMKDRIREITRKNKGWGNDYRRQKLAEYVRGWINYYKLADMKGLMTETDEWLKTLDYDYNTEENRERFSEDKANYIYQNLDREKWCNSLDF